MSSGTGSSGGVDPGAGVPPPAPVETGSLGILGGTFDPVHLGHLAIAEEVREALGLERVLFMPAARPPHKPDRPVTPAADRLAMVELAVADNPWFEVSRLEVDRGGSRTPSTRSEELGADGIVDPWLILSSEALAGLPTWRNPDRIVELCRLAVVPRAGHDDLDVAWLRERLAVDERRVRFVAGPLLPISGSVVRRRVAAGRSVRYLVPDPVARHIADHLLYLEPAGGS